MSEQSKSEQDKNSPELQQSNTQENSQADAQAQTGSDSDSEASPSPIEQKVSDTVTDTVENITGVDVSKEVTEFVAASKKLLDAIFSGVTKKLEQKINSYITNLTK